jgi:glycosyltransferase involved in cell wall biosynthesis
LQTSPEEEQVLSRALEAGDRRSANGRRRVRVLTVIDSLTGIGGAEMLAAQIALHLDRTRFASAICTTRPSVGSLIHAIRAEGLPVLSLDRSVRVDVSEWRRFLAFLRRERFDIVHTHKFGSNAWGIPIARLAGVPVVIAHEHGRSLGTPHLRNLVNREVIARGADVFLAVCKSDRRRMIASDRIDPARIRVVPNGIVDPPAPAPCRSLRAELGIADAAPLVGVVAGLRRVKALEVLVEAAVVLRDEFPQLRVVIAGAGPEEAPLRELVRRRGVASVIQLLGERQDVAKVLAALDVAVLCSDSEGSPLALLEYSAAGKAIVATGVGGVPELLDDGVHGLLVPPRDPRSLARAIACLLRDPKLREQLGRRARAHQQREFTLDVTIRRLELLYEELFRATLNAQQSQGLPVRP